MFRRAAPPGAAALLASALVASRLDAATRPTSAEGGLLAPDLPIVYGAVPAGTSGLERPAASATASHAPGRILSEPPASAPSTQPARERSGAPSTQPGTAPSPAPASAPSEHREGHAQHTFEDTDRYVRMFEDPARAAWQKPAEVVAALHIGAGQAVADIGSGSGYFTIPFARAVGTGGKVYAVDIEPGMFAHIQKRSREESAPAILPVLAEPDDAKLPPSSVDLVFICDTWHHIQGRVGYLQRLLPALRPGARVVIVDFEKRPLPVGPPPEEKLDRGQVLEEFREAGFVLAEEHGFLPYQYFLVFVTARPASGEGARPPKP